MAATLSPRNVTIIILFTHLRVISFHFDVLKYPARQCTRDSPPTTATNAICTVIYLREPRGSKFKGTIPFLFTAWR